MVKIIWSEIFDALCDKKYNSFSLTGNTSDGELVARQLTKGISTKTFIDPFKATSISTYLDSPMIRLDELKDVQASYGILLSGELRQTAKCVQKYVSENNDAFLRQLSASTAQFKVSSIFKFIPQIILESNEVYLPKHLISFYPSVKTSLKIVAIES